MDQEIPLKRVKTFLFDMGNVLVFFSHPIMCRQMAEVCGVSPPELKARVFDSALQWDFERGFLSEEEFHRTLEAIFEKPIDFELLRQASADIFELNTTVIPVLDSLKDQGYRLVLISNTCTTHFDWVREKYDVLDRFDDFVVSYEAGAIKPESAIYELALTKIQCDPDECLYTDDIPEYVERGEEFGLKGTVFTTTDRFVHSLRTFGIECP